jgi:hypothetical protein
MWLVSGTTCLCEQLYTLMKNVKSRTRMCLTDKHLEGCIQIATKEIKPDIEKLLKQKQYQVLTHV